MSIDAYPKNWSTNEVLTEPDLEGQFDHIRNQVNARCLFLADASQTVTATVTFGVSQTFSAGLAVTGTITMVTAASRIVPGATSFAIRNNADGADNLLVSNAGAVTVRDDLTVSGDNLNVRALTYTWPSAHGAGGLSNNGSGTLSWTGDLRKAARAYASGVSVGNSAVVPFAAESFDNGTFHDNASNNSRLTVPETGLYALLFQGGSVSKGGAAGGAAVQLRFRKNGTDLYSGQVTQEFYAFMDSSGATGPSVTGVTIAALAELTATDYIEILHTSGDTTTSTISGGFYAVKLGVTT